MDAAGELIAQVERETNAYHHAQESADRWAAAPHIERGRVVLYGPHGFPLCGTCAQEECVCALLAANAALEMISTMMSEINTVVTMMTQLTTVVSRVHDRLLHVESERRPVVEFSHTPTATSPCPR